MYPLITSLFCMAAALIQSWSGRQREDTAQNTPKLNPALGWRNWNCPHPLIELTIFQQPPHWQPAPSCGPASASTIYSHVSVPHAPGVRGSDSVYQPLPAGPTDKWQQNITASIWILDFFFLSLRAEPNSGPRIKLSLFILSKAVSGGYLFKEKAQRHNNLINK